MQLIALGAALACLAQLSGSADAQELQQQGAQGVIRFPFAPPTGTVLRYRVTKTATGAHSPPDRILDEELTYQADAEGYVLQIRTAGAWVGGHSDRLGDPGFIPMPMQDIVGIATPISLRLNASGRAIVVDDWDELRATIRLIPEQVAQSAPPPMRSRVREAATNAIQPILELDENAAWTLVASEWPPVLTYGGVLFELNKRMTFANVHYLYGGAVPVKLVHEVRVVKRPGGFSLDETQHPDQADFAAAVTQFYDRLAKIVSPEALAVRRGSDASLGHDVVRTATTHVEVDADGILQSGFWEVKYQKPDGSVTASEKVSFEKLPGR